MKPLIYGINHQALQLDHYLHEEYGIRSEAFLVDGQFLDQKQKQYPDVKLVAFEQIKDLFPKEEYDILLSFGYKNMVRNREEKFKICKGGGIG